MLNSQADSRRGDWQLFVLAVLVPCAVLVAVWATLRIDANALRAASAPQEGYYWSAAQFQIAFGRAREELRAIAAGAQPDYEELHLRAAVLASKAKILTDDSPVNAFFKRVPAYGEARQEIRAFSAAVVPILGNAHFGQPDARIMLGYFDRLEPIILELTNEVRLEEIRTQDARIASLAARRGTLLTIVLVLLGLLTLLCVTALNTRRRINRHLESERHAVLETRVAVEGMKAAIDAKSQFLSMVSHELRSPLQTLLSSIDLLQLSDDSDENVQAMERITRAAGLLNRQLRDLLTLARGEAGKMELRPEPFEVRDFMTELVAPHRVTAREKGLAFVLKLPPTPIFAVADSDRIDQVLSNLIANAVKYTRQGNITVTLDLPDEEANRLIFRIEDSGEGIPRGLVPEVFKPFQRLADLKKSDEGAGIGLAVVSVVLMHLGGEIDVQTEMTRGTRFVVSIPVLLEDEDAPFDSGQSHQILIVDDHEDILESLVALGSRLGYACDSARSAAEATNYLASKRYDAVLIDLEMPVKRGVELAWDIRRSDWPNKTAMLIAISASDAAGEGHTAPFNLFLAKPIGIQRLDAALGSPMSAQK